MSIKSIFNPAGYCAAALVAAALSACGSSDSFTLSGKIVSGGAATVELTYYADGAVRRAVASSGADGRFRLEAASTAPALAFLTISGSSPVAAFVVANGDDIECEVSESSSVWTAGGNKASELLARFAADNAAAIAAGNYTEINARVAEYVRAHPSETGAAALLVTRFYSRGNEFLADSLAELLSPDARTHGIMQNFMASLSNQLTADARANVQSMALYDRRDTTVRFTPARHSSSLLAFVGTDRTMRDSILPRLRELTQKWPEKRCRVIEVSLARDSATWKRSVASDSATWVQAWAPGTVAAQSFRRLAVSRNPFFIVADSVGRQLYRGSEISDAVRTVNTHLTSRK